MRKTPLLVAEVTGSARSGKGSIVEQVAARNGWAVEETGGDYRTVTYSLLEEGIITPDMPEELIQKHVNTLSVDRITEIVARRKQIEVEAVKDGKDRLHTEAVDTVVPIIGGIPHVRTAIKAGFAKRVAAVAADENYDVLLVDGRKLAAVVKTVPNTQLFLRIFVSCSDDEGIARELAREGKLDDKGRPVNKEAYWGAYKRVAERNERDRDRPIDPVMPDVGSLDYWRGGETIGFDPFTDPIHRGMGSLAASSGSQVHFDTGHYRELSVDDPVASMVNAADVMIHEALAVFGPDTKRSDNERYLQSLHV